MDITRDNFKDELPVISAAINSANFICIDGEFTGLDNGTYNLTVYDSADERFQKLSRNTENFLLLQFGISTFCWDEEALKYDVKAFNFYIFPVRSSFTKCPDRIFSCQSSSVEFLIQQGFDFNKAFKKGIPFLHENEVSSILSLLEEKQAMRDAECKSSSRARTEYGNPARRLRLFYKDATILNTLKCEVLDLSNVHKITARARKILYQSLPKKFPDQILMESRINEQTKHRQLVVIRGADEETRKLRCEQIRKRESEDLENAVGFSKVINLLNRSEKLIVGHNMLLDLIFTMRQFVTPLPPTLDQFKPLVQCIFPRVLDTKLMASMLPLKEHIQNSALGELNARLKEPPFTLPNINAPGKYHNGDDSSLHEAAYDSFITGVSFVTMASYLTSLQGGVALTSFSSITSVIGPYINKVFLMRAYDIPYLNLSGPDLVPNRNHVFYMEFPSSWKSADLRHLFSPLGQINIAWISGTECLVGLYDKSQAKNVKTTLMEPNTAEPRCFNVSTYEEYRSTSHPSQVHSSWPRDLQPSVSTSFTSGLQANSVDASDAPSIRKRPTLHGNNVSASNRDGPQVKRQKSQGEKSPDHSIHNVQSESSEAVSRALQNIQSNRNVTALFEVPDEW